MGQRMSKRQRVEGPSEGPSSGAGGGTACTAEPMATSPVAAAGSRGKAAKAADDAGGSTGGVGKGAALDLSPLGAGQTLAAATGPVAVADSAVKANFPGITGDVDMGAGKALAGAAPAQHAAREHSAAMQLSSAPAAGVRLGQHAAAAVVGAAGEGKGGEDVEMADEGAGAQHEGAGHEDDLGELNDMQVCYFR